MTGEGTLDLNFTYTKYIYIYICVCPLQYFSLFSQHNKEPLTHFSLALTSSSSIFIPSPLNY